MPSITYWNRLEPRPRAPSLGDTLAARVRDPLWFLTRQWQLGEFRGEDAGSPAFIQVAGSTAPVGAVQIGATLQPYAGATPIEYLVEREGVPGDDLTLQVELGQTFERLLVTKSGLGAAARTAVLNALRASGRYALGAPAAGDADAARFFLVCGARALDGVKLHDDARATPPAVPPGVVIADAAQRAGLLATFAALVAEVAASVGTIGATDAAAWQTERLEYEATVTSVDGDGAPIALSAHPDLDANLDWHAFDLRAQVPADAPAPAPAPFQRSVLPTHVRFRGMPNARWWDFESGATDFGAIAPDCTDPAKLVVMDFMLVQGNDWFVVPLEQPVGTLARIGVVQVTNVFGESVEIGRASGQPPGWSLFTAASESDPAARGDFLFIPPSATGAVQVSAPIEDVGFVRDELANLVWAVEHTVPGALGQARPGYERGLAPAPAPAGPGLHYRIQTDVPRHWIPFVPVLLDAARGEIALERAALLDTSVAPPAPILPVGRVLRPTPTPAAVRVREEEVPRAGVRIRRAWFRSRWIDGTTYLWLGRERRAAGPDGASGLRFDLAIPG